MHKTIGICIVFINKLPGKIHPKGKSPTLIWVSRYCNVYNNEADQHAMWTKDPEEVHEILQELMSRLSLGK